MKDEKTGKVNKRGGALRRRLWNAAFYSAAGYLIAAMVLVLIGLLPNDRSADVAVVLGSKVNEDGQPSERLVMRLSKALELYRAGRVRVIIVSGGLGREGYHEDQVMRDWLLAWGVPAGAVITDGRGVNTAATAANAAAIMKARGLRTAIVVTQYFHLPRARLAMRRAGVKEVGGASPRYFDARDLYSIAREVPAFIKYLLLNWP